MGSKAGIPVLVIDILKGYLAVTLISLFPVFSSTSTQFLYVQLGLGLAALLGHLFPLFAQFKGGKGVATLLGVTLAIQPLPTLCAIGIFLIVLLISHYVSLSSISAAISFPIFVTWGFSQVHNIIIIFALIIATAVIITHRKNIIRLFQKKESRVYLFSKKR